MNRHLKLLITLFLASFLFADGVWAFPINQGDMVKMGYGDIYSLEHEGTVYNSFCVEKEKTFQPGTLYKVASVGSVVMNQNDPISDASIWLYASYWDNHFGAHTESLMSRVQNAIWYAENEITDSSDYDTLVGNETIFSVTGWDIQVVNLTNSDGSSDNQSQLTGVRVPEPATMLLLGTGLIGLAGLSRKKLKR